MFEPYLRRQLKKLIARVIVIEQTVSGFIMRIGIKNVTYAELVNAINANELIEGKKYRLTDFKTRHYMFDYDTRLNDINIGTTEALLLTATSSNKLDSIARSESYPRDIIYYDWNPANWMLDPAYATAELATGTLEDPDVSVVSIVPGWMGVIYYREDTKQNVSTGYDFRNVKFRRWKPYTITWDAGGNYAKGTAHMGNETGMYVSLRNNNQYHALSDTDWWCKYLDFAGNNTDYTCNKSSLAADPLDFIDVHTFTGIDQYNAYEYSVQNVHIAPCYDNYLKFQGALGASIGNNVFHLSYNVEGSQSPQVLNVNVGSFFTMNTFTGGYFSFEAGDEFSNNVFGFGIWNSKFGSYCIGNTIRANFNSNVVAGGFTNNYAGSMCTGNHFYQHVNNNVFGEQMSNNKIGNEFSMNSVGTYFNANDIGAYAISNLFGYAFAYNTIGNLLYNNTFGSDIRENAIGHSCVSNTVDNGAAQNTIGNGFGPNTIGDSFTKNHIGNNFSINIVSNKVSNNVIGDSFIQNQVGTSCGSNTFSSGVSNNLLGAGFTYNIVSGNFSNNNFASGCTENTFTGSFMGNTIGENCRENIFKGLCESNTFLSEMRNNLFLHSIAVNYSSATHVVADYTCTILSNANSAYILTYYNASNVEQVVVANA